MLHRVLIIHLPLIRRYLYFSTLFICRFLHQLFVFSFFLVCLQSSAVKMSDHTPDTTFLDSCEQQTREFPHAVRTRADAVLLKSRLSVYHADFRVNEAKFVEILRHSRFWMSGERLTIVGYRGQLMLLAEWQILDHELSMNPRCRLCSTRVPTPLQWMAHVIAGDCVIIDPLPWFSILSTLPLLNTMS